MNKRKPIHTLLALLLALVMLLPYLPQPAQAASKRNGATPDEQIASLALTDTAKQPSEAENDSDVQNTAAVHAAGLTEDAILTCHMLDRADAETAAILVAMEQCIPTQEITGAFTLELEQGEILPAHTPEISLNGILQETVKNTILLHFAEDDTLAVLDYIYDEAAGSVSFQTGSFGRFAFVRVGSQPARRELDLVPETTFPETNRALSEDDCFAVGFVSGAKKTGDKYIWTAPNTNADHRFTYVVDWLIPGTEVIPTGQFEIRIPKSILRDRNGDPADYYDVGVPDEDEELDESVKLVCREEGDEVVIYNILPLDPADAGSVEFSYLTSKRTPAYQEMAASAAPTARYILNGQTVAELTSVPVYIDTNARISSTEKRQPNYYTTWSTSWGAKPADADNYFYLVWEIRSVVTNATQAYTFRLDDTFTVNGGNVVGYRMQSTTGFSATNTARVESITGTDYRYDYILTRHSKANYQNLSSYTLLNKVKATVTPVDGYDPATSAVSTKSWFYEKPVFRPSTGHFHLGKYGLYNGGNIVRSSENISDYGLGNITAENKDITGLRYYLYTEGHPYPWTLEAGTDAGNPANYGKKPVTYTITDESISLGGQQLGSGDYQFDSVSYSFTIKDADFNTSSQSFVSKDAQFKDTEFLDFYAKMGDGDYVKVTSLKLKNRIYQDTNTTYVRAPAPGV